MNRCQAVALVLSSACQEKKPLTSADTDALRYCHGSPTETLEMFEHKLNLNKNAILCVLKGQFDEEEARQYNVKFKQGVDKLEPGMTVISDLSEFTPAGEEVRLVLAKGTEYALSKGIGRSVRIVKDSVTSKVGNIQFNKTARSLDYEVEIVGSFEEAKELLGW